MHSKAGRMDWILREYIVVPNKSNIVGFWESFGSDDDINGDDYDYETQGEMGRGKFGTVYHVVGRKDGISYASKHVKYRCTACQLHVETKSL